MIQSTGDGADYGIIYPRAAEILKKNLDSGRLKENFLLGEKMKEETKAHSDLEKRYAAMTGYLSNTGMELYEVLLRELSDEWGNISPGGKHFIQHTLRQAMAGSHICDVVLQVQEMPGVHIIHKGTSTMQ